MGWDGMGWDGPHCINRYLGIPFALNPSTKDMWEWLFAEIEKVSEVANAFALLGWDGRVQVVQKVLSSHATYFTSTCLFSNYQVQ